MPTTPNMGWAPAPGVWMLAPMAESTPDISSAVINNVNGVALQAVLGGGSVHTINNLFGGGSAPYWNTGDAGTFTISNLPGNPLHPATSAVWCFDMLARKIAAGIDESSFFDFRDSALSSAPFLLRVEADGRFRLQVITTGGTYAATSPTPYFPKLNDQHVRLVYDFSTGTAKVYAGDAGTEPALFWTLNTDTNPLVVSIAGGKCFLGNGGTDWALARFRMSTLAQTDVYPSIGTSPVVPSTKPVGHILDSDTLALWRHDEVSGTAIVDATGNYPLVAGPQTSIVSGNVLNARLFTGVGTASGASDFETASVDAAFVTAMQGDFTIEALVKTDQQNGDAAGAIFTFGWGTPGPSTQFSVSVAAVHRAAGASLETKFNVFGALASDTSGGWTAFDGQYAHVAFRVKNGVGQLYVNGYCSRGGFSTPSPSVTTNPFVILGSYITSGGPSRFKGIIDEIRVSKVARTEEEIRVSAQRTLGLPEIRLLAWPPDSGTDFSVPLVAPILTDHSGGSLIEGFWGDGDARVGYYNSFIPSVVLCPVDGLPARYNYNGANAAQVITKNTGASQGPPRNEGYPSSDLLNNQNSLLHTIEICICKPNLNFPGGGFHALRICDSGLTSRAGIECYPDGKISVFVQSNNTGLYYEAKSASPILPDDRWLHLRGVMDYIHNTINLYIGPMGEVPAFVASSFTENAMQIPASGQWLCYGDDFSFGRVRCSHILRTDAYTVIKPSSGGGGSVAFNQGFN